MSDKKRQLRRPPDGWVFYMLRISPTLRDAINQAADDCGESANLWCERTLTAASRRYGAEAPKPE